MIILRILRDNLYVEFKNGGYIHNVRENNRQRKCLDPNGTFGDLKEKQRG